VIERMGLAPVVDQIGLERILEALGAIGACSNNTE
jgi:hypothetical protein